MMAAAHGSEAGTFQSMTPDEELLLIFGALHLVALALGVVLFAMFLRSDTRNERRPPDDDEQGGGGGNDRLGHRPRTPPSPGGIPLPDADQARTRLRTHEALRDAYRRRERRRVAEPTQPARRRVAR
jgi:hypothetical protein